MSSQAALGEHAVSDIPVSLGGTDDLGWLLGAEVWKQLPGSIRQDQCHLQPVMGTKLFPSSVPRNCQLSLGKHVKRNRGGSVQRSSP